MTDRETRAAALNLIRDLTAAGEAEMEANALGWTLGVSYPPEKVTETLHGLWEDPVEALREAERWQTELNRGNPPTETAPYVVKVRLVERWRGTSEGRQRND